MTDAMVIRRYLDLKEKAEGMSVKIAYSTDTIMITCGEHFHAADTIVEAECYVYGLQDGRAD